MKRETPEWKLSFSLVKRQLSLRRLSSFSGDEWTLQFYLYYSCFALELLLVPQNFRPSDNTTVVSSPAAFVERVSPNYLLRPFRTRNLEEKMSFTLYVYGNSKSWIESFIWSQTRRIKGKLGQKRPNKVKSGLKRPKDSKKNPQNGGYIQFGTFFLTDFFYNFLEHFWPFLVYFNLVSDCIQARYQKLL